MIERTVLYFVEKLEGAHPLAKIQDLEELLSLGIARGVGGVRVGPAAPPGRAADHTFPNRKNLCDACDLR